ncbi:MAG: acetate--CoA ligase family protein [Chloroflexota bacterium]|nr:acetate--CoA ligase family protein [Chloroflexota bacterium]
MKYDEIVGLAHKEGRTALNELESKEVLKEAGIDSTRIGLARTREEAVSLAGEMGFPVAMKIVSSDVLHKTDAGGVKLNP